MPLEDLISEGAIGMTKAVRNFDPERGARLASYAYTWIQAQIREYAMVNFSLVKIGTTPAQKKLFFRLRSKKYATLLNGQEHLHDEQIQNIAQELNVTAKEVLEMDQRLHGMDYSLNAFIGAGDEREWMDLIEDEGHTQETHMMLDDDLAHKMSLLSEAMAELSPIELRVIQGRRLREEPMGLAELAAELNMSMEGVRVAEMRSLKKLNRSMTILAKERGIALS
jgi:RNA polymerase sigma-32 factor